MSEIAVDNNDLETQKQIKSISRWCEDKIAKKDEAKAKFDETFSKFPGAAMDASQSLFEAAARADVATERITFLNKLTDDVLDQKSMLDKYISNVSQRVLTRATQPMASTSQIRTFYDRIITMAWAELIEYVNLH